VVNEVLAAEAAAVEASGAASGEAGISMGIAAALLVVGFLLGFLVGARSKQLAAKLSQIGKAILSMKSLLNIPDAAAADQGLAGADTGGDDDDDDIENDGKDAENSDDFLDKFLDMDPSEGLDDHPDLEVNPIFMYNIKKAKDEARADVRRQSLLAEGLSIDEADQRMLAGESGGGGDSKANPLAFLISVGARVQSASGKTSEEMQKKIEIKRKQRNVQVYLSKNMNIETGLSRTAKEEMDGGKGSKGGKKSAYDVARETRNKPVGGAKHLREQAQLGRAKTARKILRHYQQQHGGKGGPGVVHADLGDRRQAVGAKDAAAILGSQADDLAALLPEGQEPPDDDDEEEEEDDEEGEEGEEGEEEEDEGLEA